MINAAQAIVPKTVCPLPQGIKTWNMEIVKVTGFGVDDSLNYICNTGSYDTAGGSNGTANCRQEGGWIVGENTILSPCLSQ